MAVYAVDVMLRWHLEYQAHLILVYELSRYIEYLVCYSYEDAALKKWRVY